MSKSDTFFGVALGALVVGATLTVQKVLSDPEAAEKLRRNAEKACHTVGEKVKEGCDILGKKLNEGYAAVREKAAVAGETVREKAGEGYAIVREKAEEAGASIRSAVDESAAARKIKKKISDIRRAAEPAEEYLRDEMQAMKKEEKEAASDETPASDAE